MILADNKTHVAIEFLTEEEVKLLKTKIGKQNGIIRNNPLFTGIPYQLIKLGGLHYATIQNIERF